MVFLHGLESGPNGRKARYLRAQFPSCSHVAPDLQMSALDLRMKNSFIRNMFNVRWSLEGCADDAMAAIRTAENADAPAADPAQLGANAQGGKKLFLVASSWGAAVAMHLVSSRGLRPDRMLLIAPAVQVSGTAARVIWPHFDIPDGALDHFRNRVQLQQKPHAEPRSPVMLVHGTDDKTVPIEASRALKAQFPFIDVMEVAGGDHSMNDALHLGSDMDADQDAHSGGQPTLRALIEAMMLSGDLPPRPSPGPA